MEEKPTTLSPLNSTRRLQKEYVTLKRDPFPYITAEPLPTNILEWHFVLEGPKDSPFEGGVYHGALKFPAEFPFKPPKIYMLTPNGRFKTNQPLCFTKSDNHKNEWTPSFTVGGLLTQFLSFMLDSAPIFGSVQSTVHVKHMLAKKSMAFNMKNQQFRELFPQFCLKYTGKK